MNKEEQPLTPTLPYVFQSKVTQQGIITIPFSLKLVLDKHYLFNFQPLRSEIIYSQVKQIKHSGQRQYVSCRIKSPFLQKGDEVKVTIVKEFKASEEFTVDDEDEEYSLLFNQTVRCLFLYSFQEKDEILTAEESKDFLGEHPNYTKQEFIKNSLDLLNKKDDIFTKEEKEFFDILRFKNYAVIRFVGKKRALSFDVLQQNPSEEAKKAYETYIPFVFIVLTKIDYTQFLLSQHIRTRFKLFLEKFQSVSSYLPYVIKEFSSLLQSDIFEIMTKSDDSTRKFNSLDDVRFWFFIPAEFHDLIKKIQMDFYSGKKFVAINELIESMKTEKGNIEAKQLVVNAIEWLYRHQVITVREKDGEKIVEMYKIE